MNQKEIEEVLKTGLTESGRSAADVSKAATGQKDAIQRIFRGHDPSITRLAKICDELGFQLTITKGKNLIFARENQENTYKVDTLAAPFDPEIHKSEHVLVPKLAVRASAGHGAINDHERPEHLLAFRRAWFHKHGLRLDRLGAIEVSGDSMEPTLLDGETILINCGCPMPPPLETLVVARVNDDALVVKRLYKWDDDYMLLSDNRIYRPIKLMPGDELIGEVVWRGVWIARPTGE